MKYLLSLLVLSFGLQSLAIELPAEAVEEQEQTFTLLCGSREDLQAFASKTGEKVTEADLAQVKQSRQFILQVLKDPQPALKAVLDEGNKSDTGAFGLLITCGALVVMKDKILEKGCYDLDTNQPVKDNGGIAACEKIIEQLGH